MKPKHDNLTEGFFKKEIEKRSLTPSDGSWEKLQKQLNTPTQNRTPKALYAWVSVAAMVVLGGIFWGLFQNPHSNPTPQAPIVLDAPTTPVATPTVVASKTQAEPAIAQKRANPVVVVTPATPADTVFVAYTIPEDKLTVREPENIDLLLQEAQQRLQKSVTRSGVTAQQLLEEAETDVNESFRNRVLEHTVKKFEQLKEAYATRNYK